MEINKILNTKQAASLLGVKPFAVKMRAYRGILPSFKCGQEYRFKLSELVDYMDRKSDENAIKANTQPKNQFERLLTRPQAAEMLNMAPATLYARSRAGIPPLVFGKLDNKWMYRLIDVVDAIDNPHKEGECEKVLPVKEKTYVARDGSNTGEIQYETITAKCPYCSEPHEKVVVKGSSKWQYCPRHEGLRKISSSGYHINLPKINEY